MAEPAVRTLGDLLNKHQVGLSVEDVLDELDSAFTAVPGAAPISEAELDFLRSHAGPAAAQAIDSWSAGDERRDRARAALLQFGTALSGSISIKDAASTIDVDRSRISRRITAKTLWAFDFRGGRRIPRWQFLGNTLLPGLDVIVPAIPAGAAPAVVEALMHTAQPDFDDRTPIEYLATGGNPTVVAGFLADLGRW